MRKSRIAALAMLLLISVCGCNKPQPEEPTIVTLVSTIEVENENGTIVEALYSDSTRMYFRLLSDTTAEVVSYHDFYDLEHESAGWVYRGKVTIPEIFSHSGKDLSVIGIGDNAFGWYMDEYSYYDASLVTEVVLPQTITYIGNVAFYQCNDLTSVNIPNSVTFIGQSAFARTGLTSVEIPSSMTEILYGCFAVCEHMTSVKLPNTIVHIGDGAFADCTSLNNFEIPESVEFLGNYVFLRSNILKTLVCRPTTPPAKMVYGIPSEGPIYLSDSIQIETIYVPMESVVEYKNDSVWQVYSDIITGL